MDYLEILKKFDKAIVTENTKLSRIYEKLITESKELIDEDEDEAVFDARVAKSLGEDVESPEKKMISAKEFFESGEEKEVLTEGDGNDLFKDEIVESEDEKKCCECGTKQEVLKESDISLKLVSAKEFFGESEEPKEEEVLDEHKTPGHHLPHNLNECDEKDCEEQKKPVVEQVVESEKPPKESITAKELFESEDEEEEPKAEEEAEEAPEAEEPCPECAEEEKEEEPKAEAEEVAPEEVAEVAEEPKDAEAEVQEEVPPVEEEEYSTLDDPNDVELDPAIIEFIKKNKKLFKERK